MSVHLSVRKWKSLENNEVYFGKYISLENNEVYRQNFTKICARSAGLLVPRFGIGLI